MSQLPTCTRRLEFDAAHRVMLHESKCKMLHGHRYVVEATFAAARLDALGRVIDFGAIKEILGKWVEDNWDHTTILSDRDQGLGSAIEGAIEQKIYYMPNNPTAENMAHYLLHEICPKLFTKGDVRCIKIRLWETPNCYVDAEL